MIGWLDIAVDRTHVPAPALATPATPSVREHE